jgi:hypothetical protein
MSSREWRVSEIFTCERCGSFTKEHELQVVAMQRLCSACQTIRRGEVALHPVRRLYGFALFSPALAVWLLATNAARLGAPAEARWLRVAAVGLLVVAGVLGSIKEIPGLVLVAVQFAPLLAVMSRWKDRIDGHLLQGGARAPLLPTVLVVVGVVAVVVGLALLAQLLADAAR